MEAVTATCQTRQHVSHKTEIKKQSRKIIRISCYLGTIHSLFFMLEIDICLVKKSKSRKLYNKMRYFGPYVLIYRLNT